MSWGEGYVTEIEYSTGYFSKLGPRFTQAVLTLQGVETRGLDTPTYLELGFGQGLTLNLHAATNPGEWWGTDFNPAHVLGATALAEASGTDLHLLDESFEQFSKRGDLPQFDMIALHGIWSWISDHNRDIIVDILARRLRPGGTVYLSSNNLTGWAALSPLRELLAQRRTLLGAGADPVVDMKEGLKLAQSLAEADARYFQTLPTAKTWLEQLTQQDPVYLVHEYFDAHWKLMSFPEILQQLSAAKLGFAGTADPWRAVEEIVLSERARKIMEQLQHPTLREMVLDYFTMTQLRSDYFQRGVRRIPSSDLSGRLAALRFIPIANPAETPMKLQTPQGEVPLNEAIYAPLIDLLVKNGYVPIDFSEIACALEGRANDFQIRKMLLTLVGADRLAPAHPAKTAEAVAERTIQLNGYLLKRSEKWAGVSHLASPITGGGIGVSLFDQVFLASRREGHTKPQDWADHALARLDAFGKRIMQNGQEITDRKSARSYLTEEARTFADKRLPILGGLGIG